MDLKSIAHWVGRQDATPQHLVKLFDSTAVPEPHRYRLKPADGRIATVYIGFEGDRESLRYVDLEFSSEFNLTPAELSTIFGRWRTLPAAPEGPAHKIRFQYDEKELPFLVLVFADLSEDPQNVTSRVERLLFRREERI